MTNSRRVTKIGLVVFGVLLLASASWAQKGPPAAEKIAKAYGLDSFGQIEAIRYTFNIDFPGLKASKTWTWEPKADRVTYEAKDKAGKPVKVTYVRSQVNSQPENVKKEIDPGFVNDQYWLIFRFHSYWDAGAEVEDTGMHKLPIGQGSARRVVVKYSSGGYTPGDTWELYVGPDNRVKQMLFRHGGTAKPSLVTADLGRLQEGRPSPCVYGSPRHCGWQAANAHFFGRCRQADGVRHLGERPISYGAPRESMECARQRAINGGQVYQVDDGNGAIPWDGSTPSFNRLASGLPA